MIDKPTVFFTKRAKKVLTFGRPHGIIIFAPSKAQRCARVVELADSLDSGSSVHYARAGSSPASRTMTSVHNATEQSYVKEQSKGCSFAISMGLSAPMERPHGRSFSFNRPCPPDTQWLPPGGCPAPRYPGIPPPPANPTRVNADMKL